MSQVLSKVKIICKPLDWKKPILRYELPLFLELLNSEEINTWNYYFKAEYARKQLPHIKLYITINNGEIEEIYSNATIELHVYDRDNERISPDYIQIHGTYKEHLENVSQMVKTNKIIKSL